MERAEQPGEAVLPLARVAAEVPGDATGLAAAFVAAAADVARRRAVLVAVTVDAGAGIVPPPPGSGAAGATRSMMSLEVPSRPNGHGVHGPSRDVAVGSTARWSRCGSSCRRTARMHGKQHD